MAAVCPLLSSSSADYDVALMFFFMGKLESEFLQQLFILVKIRNVNKNMGHEVGYRGSSLSLVTIFSIIISTLHSIAEIFLVFSITCDNELYLSPNW